MGKPKFEIVKDVTVDNCRISVHITGFVVLHKATIKLMGAYAGKTFKVGKNKHKQLFLLPINEPTGTIKLHKHGLTFAFYDVALFHRLGCRHGDVFKVTKHSYEGCDIFKLVK